MRLLMKVIETITKLDAKDRKKLLSYLVENKRLIARNHQLLFKSFLFNAFKDENLLKEIAGELFKQTQAPEHYHCLIWNILNNLFQNGGNLNPKTVWHVREDCMRPSYHQMMRNILNCVQDTETYHSNGEVKKVAIVVSQVLSILHAPTKNLLLMASGLMQQHGLEVHVINTNLMPFSNPVEYFNGITPNFYDGFVGKQVVNYEDPDFGKTAIQLYSRSPKPFDLHSMVDIWDYIEKERFDVLINLGDVLFSTDYFYQKIPILSINTTRNLPIAWADQYLLSHDALNPAEKEAIDKLGIQEPALNWNLNITPEKGEESFDKTTYQVPADAFVFVVAGNRLGRELDKQFLEICHRLLEDHEKNYLFFVGDHKEVLDVLKKAGLVAHERVKSFDFQQDLRSFYAMCDVYLNPFRSGGNVSAQLALKLSIPVVTLAEGDVSTSLPPALRCQNQQDFEHLALSLSRDALLLADWQKKMAAVAQDMPSNHHAIQTLYSLIVGLAQKSAKKQEATLSSDYNNAKAVS